MDATKVLAFVTLTAIIHSGPMGLGIFLGMPRSAMSKHFFAGSLIFSHVKRYIGNSRRTEFGLLEVDCTPQTQSTCRL
jgi:hypothetical protein